METNKGFVINWSKKDPEKFAWFVRHELIGNGETQPINRGDLEAYINKCKLKIAKIMKKEVKA